MNSPISRSSFARIDSAFCWLFVLLVAATFVPTRAQGQSSPAKATSDADAKSDWTRFRGPNGTGISHAKTIPTSWKKEDYNWVLKLPGLGHGSPVVVGGRLYVMCGKKDTAERIIACIDANKGKILWTKAFTSKPHHLHQANSYGSSTPAADEHGVVITWADPDRLVLMALDKEGKEVWKRDLGPYDAINGAGTSPIIVDDLVVLVNIQMNANVMVRAGVLPKRFADANPNASSVIGIDRKTGKTRWTTKRETYLAGYATPCVRKLKGGQQELIVLDSAFGLTGVNLKTGDVNWQTRKLLPTRTVASPVMAGDLIFGSHGRGTTGEMICAVRAGSKTQSPKVEYEIRESAPLTPTLIVKDDLAFLWSDNGVVTCIVAKTGKQIWRKRVGGNYYGSPVWVDGHLYCIDRRGYVAVIAAGREFKMISKTALGESSFATPAIADGVMYLRTKTQLFSLGGQRDE